MSERPRLTREQRLETGETSLRVTKATTQLLRRLLEQRQEDVRAAAPRYRWGHGLGGGRQYGARADVTMDDVVYELAAGAIAAEPHAGDVSRIPLPQDLPDPHAGERGHR